MNKWIGTGVAAIAASWTFASSASAQELTIKCAYPFWPGFAPVYLAQELGYFKEEGLTVEETFDDDRGNVLPALERGDIGCDMRTVGEHQGRPRTPETQGRIIGTIDISMGGDGVLVQKDIKTMGDLKGKVFAAEPNTPARLIAQIMLKKEGLTFADLKLKDIASADAIAVFADPDVAGVAVYEPTLTEALKASHKEGAYIIASSRDFPGLITDVIVARTDDLKANPEKDQEVPARRLSGHRFLQQGPREGGRDHGAALQAGRGDLRGCAEEPDLHLLRGSGGVHGHRRQARQVA